MNYIGIEEAKLKPVAAILNDLLSSYSVYYQNLRSFHWYVNGNNFFEIHRVFEDLYNDAKIRIDDIAERILTINHKPFGSMSEYLENSKINESKDMLADEDMAAVILENHSVLIKIMRETIVTASEAGDEGTVDLIGGFLSSIEKKTWMLDAWKSRRKAGFVTNG